MRYKSNKLISLRRKITVGVIFQLARDFFLFTLNRILTDFCPFSNEE